MKRKTNNLIYNSKTKVKLLRAWMKIIEINLQFWSLIIKVKEVFPLIRKKFLRIIIINKIVFFNNKIGIDNL